MMSAPVSLDFKAFSRMGECIRVIVNALLRLVGCNVDEELAKLRQPDGRLAALLAEMIISFGKEVKPGALPDLYVKLFNFLKSLGRFDYENDQITPEHFPNEVLPSIDSLKGAQVVCLGRRASTTEVEAHLKEKKLRPATLFELLLWAILRPEEQREYPIVALGSRWARAFGAMVAYLYGYATNRFLSLYGVAGAWGGVDRFLALPDESLES